MKKTCEIILWFLLFFCVIRLATPMIKTEDELNTLFQMPVYWIIIIVIAAIATGVYMLYKNSKN